MTNNSEQDTQGTRPTAATEGLVLPPGLELIEKIGKGRTCTVYKATFQGETIALKVYKDSAAEWYRNKLNKNIAVHEMMQNRSFRQQPDLLPYTAKPIRVIGQDGKATLCFLQEYVDGLTIEELGERYGKIPGYLLRTGENIQRVCEEKGITGIDSFMKGVKLRQSASAWEPVMFDFKHIPEDKPQTDKKSFLQRLGIGRDNSGKRGFLKEWEALYEKLHSQNN